MRRLWHSKGRVSTERGFSIQEPRTSNGLAANRTWTERKLDSSTRKVLEKCCSSRRVRRLSAKIDATQGTPRSMLKKREGDSVDSAILVEWQSGVRPVSC